MPHFFFLNNLFFSSLTLGLLLLYHTKSEPGRKNVCTNLNDEFSAITFWSIRAYGNFLPSAVPYPELKLSSAPVMEIIVSLLKKFRLKSTGHKKVLTVLAVIMLLLAYCLYHFCACSSGVSSLLLWDIGASWNHLPGAPCSESKTEML